MKIKCDICENLTGNPLVDKDDNGYPLILCQNCYARKRALKRYKKQPFVPFQFKKPHTLSRDNRYGTLYSIKRQNAIVYAMELYEDDELKHTIFYRDVNAAREKRKDWLGKKPYTKARRKYKPSGDMKKTASYRKKIRYHRAYCDSHYRTMSLRFKLEEDDELITELDKAFSKPQFIRDMYREWKEYKKCQN